MIGGGSGETPDGLLFYLVQLHVNMTLFRIHFAVLTSHIIHNWFVGVYRRQHNDISETD